MQHILVAGGAGFIGTHLCGRLLMAGHRVTCLDNLVTGRADNILPLIKEPRFTFIQGDVREAPFAPYDRVYDLASPASPVDFKQFPIDILITNSQGTHRLLEVAKKANAKFLITSTSEVYGDPLEHPQQESYWGHVNPIGERSCYDEGKRFSEALTMAYVRTHNLDARIVRLFNTYGPLMRLDDGRVVPNFVRQALTGEPLTVYGDGSQTRSFCYVDDLVEALILAMETEGTKGEVFNLGNPTEHPIREFAEIVARVTNVPLNLVHRPIPPDDPTRRCPDITKAKQQLGWTPKTGLEEGLQKTVAYFAKTLAETQPCN